LPNYFPFGLEFPARTQLAMDLLRGLLRVIALENSIQPRFFLKNSFNARLTRKTLAFSKNLELHEAAVIWEDAYYNWIRPHKGLRMEIHDQLSQKWSLRTPGMAANLTDHIWTVKELLYTVPLPRANNTC